MAERLEIFGEFKNYDLGAGEIMEMIGGKKDIHNPP